MQDAATFTMEQNISTLEIAIRMGLSLVLGFIIGLEREAKRKPAGLRTNMLVALGSATFTLLSLELFYSILSIREASMWTRYES
jgi:putative Mg2+ transporter-C (MgtC) family protein